MITIIFGLASYILCTENLKSNIRVSEKRLRVVGMARRKQTGFGYPNAVRLSVWIGRLKQILDVRSPKIAQNIWYLCDSLEIKLILREVCLLELLSFLNRIVDNLESF